MYRYRAVDQADQVGDVLLREQRDLASARAFFAQEIARRRMRPREIIIDTHASYRRAIRRHARRAIHVETGLPRAGGETPQPVERSHGPVPDRLRPMRGLPSIATGQQLLEGLALAPAARRGSITRPRGAADSHHVRARAMVATFECLAPLLRAARCLCVAAQLLIAADAGDLGRTTLHGCHNCTNPSAQTNFAVSADADSERAG
jgi:hypothetical protein